MVPLRARGEPGIDSGRESFCSVPPIISLKSSAGSKESGYAGAKVLTVNLRLDKREGKVVCRESAYLSEEPTGVPLRIPFPSASNPEGHLAVLSDFSD